jgi:glycosyltransferase involved in cell wall biosynthesis
LDDRDRVIVVLDGVANSPIDELRGNGSGPFVDVVLHPSTLGLSASRNDALEHAATRYVLFVDDDVILTRPTVEAIREALTQGATVVGARLERPPWLKRLPFWMTEGQLHYLGVHAGAPPFSVWGGCMAVDAAFALTRGILFRPELGRTGVQLQSGDDSAFVAEMACRGTKPRLLEDVGVVHDFSPDRIRLRYVARRVFWQGRAEVRRGSAFRGIAKEWRRYHRNAIGSSFPHRIGSAIGCLSTLVAGMGWEGVSQITKRKRQRPQRRTAGGNAQ